MKYRNALNVKGCVGAQPPRLILYNGRSPSFRIADTHEKDGFWIFAFAQDPPKNNIFIFQAFRV